MKTRSKLSTSVFAILLLGLLGTLLPASAQDAPRYPAILTLHISAAPAEPPIIEDTADGGVVFKVNPVGSVTGDLEGTYSQRITQVDPCPTCEPQANQLIPIAAFFVIETADGSIEGYYSGAFYASEESFPDQLLNVHGQILAVTGAYADLYLADVYYDGIVDFEEVDGSLVGLGDSGTLIIAPR